MSECIYRFAEQPKQKNPKKKIYRSKYDPNGPLIGSTFGLHGTTAIDGRGVHDLKKNHVVIASFGLQPEAPDPKSFLRKGSRATNIPTVEHHNRTKEPHKPSVPSRNDKPVQGLKNSKDFVTCNAVEAINSNPKKRMDEEVRLHEEYGKVPAYLDSVKAAMEQEKQLIDMYVAEQSGRPKTEESEVMDEAERIQLINMLKQRWDGVNSVYQKYCHKVTLDTPGEIKRKAAQEAELKQLEDDIEKLSRPGPLLIRK
eukprot:scaffold2578_cov197-Alexandrium_tamarense.AAC.8